MACSRLFPIWPSCTSSANLAEPITLLPTSTIRVALRMLSPTDWHHCAQRPLYRSASAAWTFITFTHACPYSCTLRFMCNVNSSVLARITVHMLAGRTV